VPPPGECRHHAAAARAARWPWMAAALSNRPDSGAGPAPDPDPDGKSGHQGSDTTKFGRQLIDYGVSTLKYVVGLLLIPLGGLLVVIGWMVSLLELVWC
jgi:hypothetical protein